MIRPRKLSYHGVVEACGFLFDLRLISEQQMQARVLALWEPGATLHRSAEHILLRIPVPRGVAGNRAPGLPVVQRDGALLAVPMDADELSPLALPHGALVLARGGEAIVETPDSWSVEDPASWLDLAEYEVMESRSLGRSPEPVTDAIIPVAFHGRSLNGVPPPDPGLGTVIEDIRAQRAGAGGERGGWEGTLRGALSSLFSRLQGEDSPSQAGGSGSRQGTAEAHGHSGRKAQKGNSMRSTLLKAMWRSPLGRWLSVPHARYLSRMMAMFDNGDIIEALRHAIPLGGAGSEDAPPPGLATPTPRDELRLDPWASGGAGSSLQLPPELLEELKERYRRAARQLESQGKITEAAFVIAELLYEPVEAVAFLEGHGQLRLAAELAEGRDLPPSLVIRQWILAGESDRAVTIARRTGAYAAAIHSLERSHPEKGEVLRLLMADLLASSGEYAAAADVIWPIADSRHLAVAWIERGIAIGGVTGARMLARRLALPELPDGGFREQALALLSDDAMENARDRLAFAEALLAEPPTPAVRALARAVVRSLARDAARGALDRKRYPLNALVGLANDGALRADLPALPPPGPSQELALRSSPLEITIGADDAGIGPVHDAAFLPNGTIAVALGEAGVRLLARDGHTVAHFAQPAERLVVSDAGDRAIALAPRGATARIARIDFISRRASSWCRAKIDTWARSFDGASWLVGEGNEVMVIDAVASSFRALWRWKDVGIRVEAIARREGNGAFLAPTLPKDAWGAVITPDLQDHRIQERSCEVWLVDLRSHTLRSRSDRKTPIPEDWLISFPALSPLGSIADVMMRASADSGYKPEGPPVVMIDGVRCDVHVEGNEYAPAGFEHGDLWSVALFAVPEGIVVLLIDREERTVRCTIRLHGASRATARLSQETLLLADDRGRIIVLDLQTGSVLRDLRLR